MQVNFGRDSKRYDLSLEVLGDKKLLSTIFNYSFVSNALTAKLRLSNAGGYFFEKNCNFIFMYR